jgi:D-alanyl-D-alanine carboxypeptidase (penicillin-binding protein 5/6)
MVYRGLMRTVAFILFLIFPLCALASEITADSYILVEKDTFSVITGKDYHHALPPASTTKVLTSILALEKLDGQEIVVPTKNVLRLPASKLCLVPGRAYPAMDLIKGALVESANDAAYALGVAMAGSEEAFADMMNEKARNIGAVDSHFENASGLYLPGHVASAWDLALIFRYALNNKEFEEIVGTKYFLFNRGNTNVKYKNHNRLLFCFDPSIGGKTGFTRASKHCYVGAFEKEGKIYILSILGSRDLWGDAIAILQTIYTDVPTEREISMARANAVVLSSYHVKKTLSKAKKHERKRVKKARRGRHHRSHRHR